MLADWLPDALLQSIAAENHLSETAFVVQRDSLFHLRWFTPTLEIDLCGHATLAAAHVLFRHLDYRAPSVRFQTRSGVLIVCCDEDLLTLDFPARPALICETPQALSEGLGASPTTTAKARDYLAVFDTEQAVRSLQPDMPALMRLDCLGIIATAPGEDCDLVSRFFAPRAGVPEDHQTVIDSGVYGVVRHPMYAGAVPLLVGMPLWLESYAAAMLASVPIGTLVLRVLVEEQFLRRELNGYDAYTETVRYG